jgi:hypothetical protein
MTKPGRSIALALLIVSQVLQAGSLECRDEHRVVYCRSAQTTQGRLPSGYAVDGVQAADFTQPGPGA